MIKNVGSMDRIFRFILALALLSLLFMLDSNARWFGLLGLIPLFTATTRWCPAYLPFGISTCATSDKSATKS